MAKQALHRTGDAAMGAARVSSMPHVCQTDLTKASLMGSYAPTHGGSVRSHKHVKKGAGHPTLISQKKQQRGPASGTAAHTHPGPAFLHHSTPVATHGCNWAMYQPAQLLSQLQPCCLVAAMLCPQDWAARTVCRPPCICNAHHRVTAAAAAMTGAGSMHNHHLATGAVHAEFLLSNSTSHAYN